MKEPLLMPYGSFRGELMDTIPARYLHHLWTNGEFKEKNQWGSFVHKYIKANLKRLKKQCPGKW